MRAADGLSPTRMVRTSHDDGSYGFWSRSDGGPGPGRSKSCERRASIEEMFQRGSEFARRSPDVLYGAGAANFQTAIASKPETESAITQITIAYRL